MIRIDSICSLSNRLGFLLFGFSLFSAGLAYGNVTLNLEFGLIRDTSGGLAAPGTLWALVVAPPGKQLPGGLEENSSLLEADLSAARADFSGQRIEPGFSLGDSVIMATGELSSFNDITRTINWTAEDYTSIQAGGLIGIYWFPGINGPSATLPESGFNIGGLQETSLDNASGNAGMLVPSNSGQSFTIAYLDTNELGQLPIERFNAIEVTASGYQLWRDLIFDPAQIDAGEGEATADPDKDGLVNLMEYATSTAPLLPNMPPLSLSRMGNSVTLEFHRIADPELSYRVEATGDLNASPWPDVIFESSGSGNTAELVSLAEPLTSTDRFFRLSVYFLSDL